MPTRFPERLNLEVISKGISPNQDAAVIERRVTYNYSAKVVAHAFLLSMWTWRVWCKNQLHVLFLRGVSVSRCLYFSLNISKMQTPLR